MYNINDNSQYLEHNTNIANASFPMALPPTAIGTTILSTISTSNATKKVFTAENLTDVCKIIIAKLKDRNEEILPRKPLDEKSPLLDKDRDEDLQPLPGVTLVDLATVVSILAGPILGVIGIGLCFTGAALPAGVLLIGIGGGLTVISIPLLKRLDHKVRQKNEVKRNNAKIEILKRLIREPPFKSFVINVGEEFGITHLSISTFAVKYDLKKLYERYNLAEAERVKKPRKKDPQNPILWDYTAYFNLMDEKVRIINKLLGELDNEVQTLNIKIKNCPVDNKTEAIKLKQQKNELFERVKKLKEVRLKTFKEVHASIVKENPRREMSSSVGRLLSLLKAAKQSFLSF